MKTNYPTSWPGFWCKEFECIVEGTGWHFVASYNDNVIDCRDIRDSQSDEHDGYWFERDSLIPLTQAARDLLAVAMRPMGLDEMIKDAGLRGYVHRTGCAMRPPCECSRATYEDHSKINDL